MIKKIGLSIFFIIVFATIVSAVGAPSAQDIHYNPNDFGDVFDWYNPQADCNCKGPWPVIIFAHPGGYDGGVEDINPAIDPWKTVLKKGYAVATVRYTLSPVQTFLTKPKMPSDLGRSVQFFRLYDSLYNVDENKVIAWGRSAGAGIWQYVVAGPEMSVPTDINRINRERSRPDLFVNNVGQVDWNILDNSLTGMYFGQPTLATVSLGNKLTASLPYMLDVNAVAHPDILVPTYFVYSGLPGTIPLTNGHDIVLGQVGLAKIKQYDPNNTSKLYSTGIDANFVSDLVSWLNANLNYSAGLSRAKNIRPFCAY